VSSQRRKDIKANRLKGSQLLKRIKLMINLADDPERRLYLEGVLHNVCEAMGVKE
jgi:hypothetical protein